MEAEVRCTEHTTEDARFYCEDCLTFICDDCVTGHGNHIKCNKIKLQEYGDRERRSLETFAKDILETKLPRIKRNADLADRMKHSLNGSIDIEIESIKTNVELIKKIFGDLQEELVEDLNKSRNDSIQSLDEFKKLQIVRHDEIKDTIDKITQGMSHLTSTDIAVLKAKLNEHINKTEEIPKEEPPVYLTSTDIAVLKAKLNEHINKTEEIPKEEPPVYLTSTDIAVLKAKLNEHLNKTEEIPKEEPPVYEFDPSSFTKKNLKYIIGTLKFPNKENKDFSTTYLEPNIDVLTSEESTSEDDTPTNANATQAQSRVNKKEFYFQKVKSFRCSKSYAHIVPKAECYHAWLVGSEISEIDLKSSQPIFTPLLDLEDDKPFVATRSQVNGLLIGFVGKRSVRQLKNENTFRRNASMIKLETIRAHSDHLSAMCTSTQISKDIVICLRNYHLTEKQDLQTVIRWYTHKKLKGNEISMSINKVEIENPVFIAEHIGGDMCITCSPEDKSSWVVLIDKHGKQKMRYPPRDDKKSDHRIMFSFIGAGFLNDGSITILDRVRFRQHLISGTGEILRIDSYKSQPSCFAVDTFDNVWIGFDDGEIRIMEYAKYENIE